MVPPADSTALAYSQLMCILSHASLETLPASSSSSLSSSSSSSPASSPSGAPPTMPSDAPRSASARIDEKSTTSYKSSITMPEPEDQYPAPRHTSHSFRTVLIFALFMSNAFFAALSLFLYLDAQCPLSGSISHTDPFAVSPDLRDARSLVRTEQRQYTGALRYDKKNGEPYRLTSASERQYFGNPSTTPGIDHAWKELLQDEFFALSAAEAKPYMEKVLTKPSSSNKYYAELGVFHNLRCLNTIRIYLDTDYYREHGAPEGFDAPRGLDRAKIDYCLDHLRQSVQCSADLTVVPMLAQDAWTGSDNVLSQPRTCRKWEDVRSWLDRRHERTALKEQRPAFELV